MAATYQDRSQGKSHGGTAACLASTPMALDHSRMESQPITSEGQFALLRLDINSLDRKIDGLRENMDTRFRAMDDRFVSMKQSMDDRFAAADSRFASMQQASDDRFKAAESRFASMQLASDARFEAMNRSFVSMQQASDARFERVDAKLESLDRKIDHVVSAFQHVPTKLQISLWLSGGLVAILGALVGILAFVLKATGYTGAAGILDAARGS